MTTDDSGGRSSRVPGSSAGAGAASASQASTIAELELVGHLTRTKLDAALDGIASHFTSGVSVPMIVECRRMTSYDAESRARFVDWHRERRTRIRGVAIVTDKALWHMVISAMAVASGQRMKPFGERDDAVAWLRALPDAR